MPDVPPGLTMSDLNDIFFAFHPNAPHEKQIAHRLIHLHERHSVMNFDEALMRHYTLGKIHPHDYCLPLNLWDATDPIESQSQ